MTKTRRNETQTYTELSSKNMRRLPKMKQRLPKISLKASVWKAASKQHHRIYLEKS